MSVLKLLFALTFLGFGAAGFLLAGHYFFNFKDLARKAGFGAYIISFAAVIATFVLDFRLSGSMPFLLLYLVMTNGLFLAFIKKGQYGVALVLSLFNLPFLGVHYLQLGSPVPPALPSSLSIWFYLHAGAFLFSYSCLTLAAFSSALYLYQARHLKMKSLKGAFLRLPPLKELDGTSYRFMGIGFPILVLGIYFGSLWSHVQMGSYWSFGPGGITASILTVFYLLCVHLRLINRWQGVMVNLMLTVSFFLISIALLAIGHLPW
jgi:ABC-type transport system involved in cytochrome c biogenesis permease subunit